MAFTMSPVWAYSMVNKWHITSESVVERNSWPSHSKFFLSSIELIISPLWAIAIVPESNSLTNGCEFSINDLPVVEYLT
ncbi:MAG: hypothetical protein A4E27_00943 [Methanobacterium sp. PtaU1.Bin242]|nr:MAG: hypothetical protein A4E27_00943 [Methanobacterium sp. PtaU1.Bin242]